MADVITTSDNSGTGIIVGVLIAALVVAVGYFAFVQRDAGPDVKVDLPNVSATVDTK